MTAITSALIKASKKAESFEYDKSKYTVVDFKVRRDSETGRLVSQKENENKK